MKTMHFIKSVNSRNFISWANSHAYSIIPQAKEQSFAQVPESMQAHVTKSLLSVNRLSDQMIVKSMADLLIKSVYGDTPFKMKDFRLEFGPGGQDA